jgi:A/G-specific adenine glycosylase
MPWRTDTQPYYILVSELMLQQTQVDRVVPKFTAFIASFPTVPALAEASLAEVLTLWSGLGYNRRAKFLHQAARRIVEEFNGIIPSTQAELMSLPGVGANTAGAILAYGFNQPAVFIETNVRTVYFYHFFAEREEVSDAELREVVAATVDLEHPREWYWALMDYGSFLKRNGAGAISKSKHYKKQSALKGSLREMRGMIIRELTIADYSLDELRRRLPDDQRFAVAVEALREEGLITRRGDILELIK